MVGEFVGGCGLGFLINVPAAQYDTPCFVAVCTLLGLALTLYGCRTA